MDTPVDVVTDTLTRAGYLTADSGRLAKHIISDLEDHGHGGTGAGQGGLMYLHLDGVLFTYVDGLVERPWPGMSDVDLARLRQVAIFALRAYASASALRIACRDDQELGDHARSADWWTMESIRLNGVLTNALLWQMAGMD